MKIAIFDLDGCISDDRHRRHLLPEHGTCDEDYAAYHALMGDDELMHTALVHSHVKEGHRILFITARPERYRSTTVRWIDERILPMENRWGLLMRPNGNMMPCPELKVHLFETTTPYAWSDVIAAYDDRGDILQAYQSKGVANLGLIPAIDVPTILHCAADTYQERNAVYKENYKKVTQILALLFPNGVPPDLYHQVHFNLFEMVVGKLTRFVESGMTHVDSIHDIVVYAAMIENELRTK